MQHARSDQRGWVVKRRERTRHLIELGGLVQKSGLVELASDDRALLYGAFLELADALQGERREQLFALWCRRGSRAFKNADMAPPTLQARDRVVRKG
jgi:Conjugal transfer protein TraD